MTLKTFKSHGISDDTEHATLRLKKILVPIDFSPASTNAFKYALRLAEEFAAELTLLYVLAPAPSRSFASIPGAPAFSESDLAGREKNLRALIASTRNGSVQCVRSTIRIGVPSHVIVEMAKDADTDLIVIATHGYTGWKHFCIGSTAERVVRAAPCPVLVVREKEHQFCSLKTPVKKVIKHEAKGVKNARNQKKPGRKIIVNGPQVHRDPSSSIGDPAKS